MGTSATEVGRIQSQPRDQRLSVRKRVSLPTALELLPGKEMWLHDLGEGGLCVTGSCRLDLGTQARARFQFPETNSLIDAVGVVAWNDDTGRAGVRFTHVEPDSTVVLRRWVKNGAMDASGSSNVNHPPDAELASRISCLSEVAELQSIIAAEQFDCDAALDLIVKRLAKLTRASGAAIALREGQDVVCRACAGNAPDVGVKLSPTSLSGECFQNGTIVLLEDSESDPRVNPEVCRQLNFRSLLVLPIAFGGEIIGIAEVLSPNARHFAGGDILVLSFLTDLIASVALPRLEPNLSAVPEPIYIPTIDELSARTELSSLTDNFEAMDSALFTQTILESPAANEVEAAAIPIPAVEASIDFVTPFKVTAAIQPVAQTIEKPLGLAIETGPSNAPSRLVLLATTVVVLLATAALLAGYYFSRSLNSAKLRSTTASANTPAAAATGPKATVQVPSLLSDVAAKPTSAVHQETKSSSSSAQKQTAAPASSSEAELRVVHGASRSNANPDSSAPEAPAIATLASRGTALLPASLLAAKTATPELQPATTSQGVTEGKLLRKVLPRYPEMARNAGIGGDVVLSARIGTDGSLHDIKVISGSPMLREAAIEAARQWRYSPYKLGSKPVETDTRITISFHR